MKIRVLDTAYNAKTIGAAAGDYIIYLPSIIGETEDLPFLNAISRNCSDAIICAVEYPGCGDSGAAAGAWKTVVDAVYDLGRLMESLSDRPVVLVGSSLGGWLAAETAAWYPTKVKALVLCNAFGLRVPSVPISSPFAERGSADLGSSFYSDANPNGLDLAQILTPSLKEEEKGDPNGLFLHLLRTQTLAGRLGFNPLMHDPQLGSRLRNIGCPTLVIWGQADGVLPSEYGRAFAGGIIGAQLVSDTTSGHFPLLEKPEEHACVVVQFLSELSD